VWQDGSRSQADHLSLSPSPQRYAAKYGKKAVVVESTGLYGGTCVNVGCVPKKLMWIVTSSYERYEGFAGQHLAEKNNQAFDWGHIKTLRDKEVARTQMGYKTSWEKEGMCPSSLPAVLYPGSDS
jgi:glutathione reductase (NADPH)